MNSVHKSIQASTKQPLVSIIMNCYNGEKFLREAIDSVIAQTYTNWEIIFWDNQSKDGSADIMKSYDDPRLHYFYAPTHTLLYEARNYAIEKSCGELIAFLDVDDWWIPEKLEKQVPLFENTEVGIVCSNYWLVNERKHSPPKKMIRQAIPTGRPMNELLKNYFVGMLTLMVRRTAFEQLDYGCDPRYHVIGDFDLVIRLSVNWKLDCIQEPLAYCRWHDDNESTRHRERSIKELEVWAAEMIKHPRIRYLDGFQTLLQSIRYDYGRLYVMQRNRHEALRQWWSLPWGKFKVKLLADILMP